MTQRPPSPEPEVPTGLGGVDDSLLTDDDLSALSPDELDLVVRAAAERRRRDEVLLARAVNVVARRGDFQRDGHRSPESWCRARLRWSPAEAARVVRNGMALARLPQCAQQAMGDDVRALGVAQLDDLGRLGANRRVAVAFDDSDELFATWSRRLQYRDWRAFVQRWQAVADADGVQAAHAQVHHERRASITFVGEQMVFEAHGGTFDGAFLRSVLDRFVDAEFAADCAEAADRLGRDVEHVVGSDLRRSHRQRVFDALVEVFRVAAGSSVVSRDPDPVVNIVVDDTTAERLLRMLAGDTTPPRTIFHATSYRCETLDGVPLAEESVMAAMLVGRLRRALVAPDGHVIELGRSRRLFTGAAREAVLLGDRRCLWLGCDIRTEHCHSDHLTNWSDGGVTSPWNGGRACAYHNVFKSSHRYTVHRGPDGEYDVRRPDGTSIGPVPVAALVGAVAA